MLYIILKINEITHFIRICSLGTDVFAMKEETNLELILIPRHDENESVREVQSNSFFNCFHFEPVFENINQNELIINGRIFD